MAIVSISADECRAPQAAYHISPESPFRMSRLQHSMLLPYTPLCHGHLRTKNIYIHEEVPRSLNSVQLAPKISEPTPLKFHETQDYGGPGRLVAAVRTDSQIYYIHNYDPRSCPYSLYSVPTDSLTLIAYPPCFR